MRVLVLYLSVFYICLVCLWFADTHAQSEEVRKAAEPLHSNTIQVVMGCLNALFGAVGAIQKDAIELLLQPAQRTDDILTSELEAELQHLRMMLVTGQQSSNSSQGIYTLSLCAETLQVLNHNRHPVRHQT